MYLFKRQEEEIERFKYFCLREKNGTYNLDLKRLNDGVNIYRFHIMKKTAICNAYFAKIICLSYSKIKKNELKSCHVFIQRPQCAVYTRLTKSEQK